MPFNGSGIFNRVENWTNDANNNLPISSSKFDTEANDWAGGFNLCLTRDNQGRPTAPISWSQPVTFTRGSDGTEFTVARSGGTNNPGLQFQVTDATGITVNLSTAQTLALAVNGTTGLSIASTGIASFPGGASISGGLTLPAPGSGSTLTVNGNTAAAAETINGNAAVGNSRGLLIAAGTNTSDYCAALQQQNGTTIAYLQGDGQGFIVTPPAATDRSGQSLYQLGYLEAPLNAQTGGSYTFALSDRGKIVTGGSGFTYTIPANASVAFPVGTMLMFINRGGANATIAITTDSLGWLPSNASGSRTIASFGVVTLYKYTTNGWYVWGFGIS